MSNEKALQAIEEVKPEQYPSIYGQGALMGFFERVKSEVSGEVPDTQSAKGRARIASLAAKVSKSKVAVEKPGRDYLRQIKELPKTIETELREFVRAMDALRDETRQPLTEWEQAEKARVNAHQAAIQSMTDLALDTENLSSDGLKQRASDLATIKLGEHWEEFEAEAARAKEHASARLAELIVARERHEAEQAELERLRAEQAEREQREREERIRQEATEKERKEAQSRAEAAERARKEAAERAELEQQQEIERARREKAEAEARELRTKQEAEDRAKQAAAAERARIEAEQEAARKEQERREANKRHRAMIAGESISDIEGLGIDESAASRLFEAMSAGSIRHVKVIY